MSRLSAEVNSQVPTAAHMSKVIFTLLCRRNLAMRLPFL